MNRYEVLVILPERLTENEIEQGLETLVKEIKALGGKPTRPTRMGRRSFARPIQKQTAGEYALLNAVMEPAAVSKLLEALSRDEHIMRIQITRQPEEVKAEAEPVAAAE